MDRHVWLGREGNITNTVWVGIGQIMYEDDM